MKITLNINDKKMDVGVEFTQSIAGALPDNKNSIELFYELPLHFFKSKARNSV